MEARDNPNYYFVSQNKSYKDENSKQYLWAPLKSKNGGTVKAYELMKQIKKGDVIVHYNNDGIPGISIAKIDSYKCNKPSSIGTSSELWNDEGTKVDVEQYFSPYKIPKYRWIKYFYENQPEYGSPLIKDGQGNEKVNLSYLCKINKALVEKVLQEMEANELSKNTAAKLRIALHQPASEIKENHPAKVVVIKKGGTPTMSETQKTINHIKSYIQSEGFTYEGNLIENFYLSLKSKPFVILAGTSGTGKTRLAKLFAESIGATEENGQYKLVPVRPDWSDSSDLFGHLDLNDQFVPGAIIDFIKEASVPENISKPYFLCLDEMNLARVEYYMSDFLSIIETRDFDSNKRIKTSALMSPEKYGTKGDAATKYGNLCLPENLYIVGTVNMDETTFPFSKKVLDRANTIEFSLVDLMPKFEEQNENIEPEVQDNDFLKSEYLKIAECASEKDFITKWTKNLIAINTVLENASLHVGYRVRDEIMFYMLNNKNAGDLMSPEEAFDHEIMQKILPRIQGSSQSIKDVLCELFKICAGDYSDISDKNDSASQQMLYFIESSTSIKYINSAKKIQFMTRRFEEDGFTSYWL